MADNGCIMGIYGQHKPEKCQPLTYSPNLGEYSTKYGEGGDSFQQ